MKGTVEITPTFSILELGQTGGRRITVPPLFNAPSMPVDQSVEVRHPKKKTSLNRENCVFLTPSEA